MRLRLIAPLLLTMAACDSPEPPKAPATPKPLSALVEPAASWGEGLFVGGVPRSTSATVNPDDRPTRFLRDPLSSPASATTRSTSSA